jgi:hypothetical protein
MDCPFMGQALYVYSLSPCSNTSVLGFEILTAVVMKSTLLWDTTPCSPMKVNRRFGGTCRLHLQGRIVSQTRNQRATCLQVGFLLRCLAVCCLSDPVTTECDDLATDVPVSYSAINRFGHGPLSVTLMTNFVVL